ncbi:uncharacterized protein LOC120286466 [Eucalyptus grandis]|uniref:uncharacterized protein LOC120286466 n=1 Tax=Eucalyptus grandis TaxID=71139 RepID=UPI00192EAFF3|nr:uncharacterized protein LOC120286466 [Eucalyptus grandis]
MKITPRAQRKKVQVKQKIYKIVNRSQRKKELNMVDFSIEKYRYSGINGWSSWSEYRIVCPGTEMPEVFVLVEDSTMSFMASQDLFNKFKALYLCVVVGVEDGKREVSFDIIPYVNDRRRNVLSGTLGSFDTDHVWFQLLFPNLLWGFLEGAVDFGQSNESFLRFSLKIRVAGATVKKLGYVMQCYQLEDDFLVELEKNRFMDPASLYEDDETTFYLGSHVGYPSRDARRERVT